ncbi:MAG TPA: ABC transporter substrate-binding protein, partial [Acidobacteriota bacterium]|nr:ABC transporter substrate-binding protein [Acidobacteriota bacterium]
MRRREFVALLAGAAAAWPLRMTHAQRVASPVIGFLDPRTPEVVAARLRGFRQGLKEAGFVE